MLEWIIKNYIDGVCLRCGKAWVCLDRPKKNEVARCPACGGEIKEDEE